ncbi:hypothetical protein [Caniella muris]|uniref:hypothetical protein n=1 Tax=Caniella muris TaxID=2941502 RepID=UPI0020406A8C|nr:hypothetical protein [Caniella muris]
MDRIAHAPLLAASAALAVALAGPATAADAAVLRAAPADGGIATLSEAALYASSAAAPLDAGSVKDPSTYCELDALIAQANRDIQAIARRGSVGGGVFGGVPGAMDARALGDRLHAAADAATRSAEEKAAETRAAEARAAELRAAEGRGAQDSSAGAAAPVAAGDADGAVSAGGGEAAGGDNAWNVSYRDEYGAAEGASDGACTQWADGYYVAHDWSESGGQIASKPDTVVVDGQRYAYAGSMVVPEGSDYYASGVYDFTHADGGIGFQTCCDGGYLVTHYVPY